MKIFSSTFLLLWVTAFMASCSFLNNKKEENLSMKEDFKLAKVNNEYGMLIPKYMKKSEDLNEDASLQYQNIFKETYVIVIDEPKEDFIYTFKELQEYVDSLSIAKNYKEIQLQLIKEAILNPTQSEEKSLKINGMDAESVVLSGELEDVKFDISYFLTFVEGKEKVYMIMAWTLKDSMNKYKPTFEKMAESFHLLK